MKTTSLYSILELCKLNSEYLKSLSDHYTIDIMNKGKQKIIYEILDAQDKQIKIEQ